MTPEEKKQKKKEWKRAWSLANKEHVYEYNKRRAQEGLDFQTLHPERVKEIKKRWALKNREKIRKKNKIRKDNNREKVRKEGREYMARKRRENPEVEKAKTKAWRQGNLPYKIRKALRGRLQNMIRSGFMEKGSKCDKTMNLVGCTAEELIRYLEAKFKPGMTWDNWGVTGWHIDHCRPLASFPNLSDPEQQREAFHYTNLQPLWAKENISKGDKWEPPIIENPTRTETPIVSNQNDLFIGTLFD